MNKNLKFQPAGVAGKIKNFCDFVLDLLFPKYCVGCGQEGVWICDKCQKQIVLIKEPTCPNCHKLSKNGRFCKNCRKKSNLSGLIIAAYYQEGPLKEAIHTFKYEKIFTLAEDLGKLLHDKLNHIPLRRWNKVGVVVVPVPLHAKRKAERGFNQAELLAKEICKHSSFKLDTKHLRKIINPKKTQVELSGFQRRKNIVGCFAWRGPNNYFKNKIILLVDDVYTTGATLQECAKILRRDAGAKKVWGAVLAKG